MGRGIKIFLCYVWPFLTISFLILCLLSVPIVRRIDTKTESFPKDLWEKGVFLNAEKNQSVIINLGNVQGYRFFLNRYEVKSSAYFLLNKQKSFILSIKDSNGRLIDTLNLSRHIKPGDIITYEFVGDNSGGCKSLSVCIYRHDNFILEKIPIFV